MMVYMIEKSVRVVCLGYVCEYDVLTNGHDEMRRIRGLESIRIYISVCVHSNADMTGVHVVLYLMSMVYAPFSNRFGMCLFVVCACV